MPEQLSLFAPEPRPERREPSSTAGVWICHGALATEATLLERIDELSAEAARDASLLARPVRVVVPSRSLRLHLGAILMARGGPGGRPLAGVLVQTLHGLACEVLERGGERALSGALFVDLLAQRFARAEPALSRGLEGLLDGYATIAGTVRDLLDAGLTTAHAEAAEEALAALGPAVSSREAVHRARALVRAAARVEAASERLGIGRAMALYRRAAERLAADPADPRGALPARAILVHGFADATGLATDLLAALVRLPGARLLLDRPPDPARPPAVEAAFTARLAERLALVTRSAEAPATADPPRMERLERLAAPGPEAETRAVASRLRSLLDAGARPEAIGVVARDLTPYGRPLARHLRRLGIPFSGIAALGSLKPAGRRFRALLELLRGGGESPCDRWLDAVVSLPVIGAGRDDPVPASPAGSGARGARRALRGRRLVDLRLACRALGAGRLCDLAAVELAPLLRRGRYALPVRQGLLETVAAEAEEAAEDEEREGVEAPVSGAAAQPAGSRAARRTVSGGEIAAAIAAARSLCRRFATWPGEARAADQLDRLDVFLRRDLGWDLSKDPEARPLEEGLERLSREIPAAFAVSFEEIRRLLAHTLAQAGAAELGGAGGGVQVLAVMEARGRSFDHLFVLGLNRDLFPRPVREDPLLPDALRAVLRGPLGDGVLPDVPIKSLGFDEERYLFAQLLSAAPAVTLSWQSADEEGRPLSPSPLVERLLAPGEAVKAPALYAASAAKELRPADEQAILAALHGGRDRFGALLPAAVAAARAELPAAALGALSPAADDLAAARAAVLAEADPDLRTAAGRAARRRLGPYFGFIGALSGADSRGDPRRQDLYVTTLENMAACPWQTFLQRLLKVEPTPDPQQALPGLDALLVGNLVHAVLERIVRAARPDAAPEPVQQVQQTGPFPVAWPADADLERTLQEESLAVITGEGIALRGLSRALAERARPFLAVERGLEWEEGPLVVLGAEIRGEVAVGDGAGGRRALGFKADRLDPGDSAGSGRRYTDYKTGKPISEAKRPDTRRRHFLARVRSGISLQAVAYGLAGGPGASGRYLFLRPDLDEREFAAAAADGDLTAAFHAAVRAALGAWEAGAFFPRLVDPAGRAEPARCSWCTVAEACLRGDSGARGRLFEWTMAAPEPAAGDAGDAGDRAASAALLGVWRLPADAGDDAEATDAAPLETASETAG